MLCSYVRAWLSCQPTELKASHPFHFSGIFRNKLISFWDALHYWSLTEANFNAFLPGYQQAWQKRKQHHENMCVSINKYQLFRIYLDLSVNAEKEKTDQSYCRSINQWFLQSLGTELSTTAMMCSDGCQCSCHAEHQCSSGGDWLAMADCYKTLHFTNNTTTPH